MSESAPERSGGGFSFDKKYGPLPAYGWILLAAGGAIVYMWWRNRQSGSSAAAPTSTTTGTSGIDYAPDIATIQSEVQDLQSGASQNAAGDQNIEQQLDTMQAQEAKERPKRPRTGAPPRKPPARKPPAPKPPANRGGRPVPKGGPRPRGAPPPRIAKGRTTR